MSIYLAASLYKKLSGIEGLSFGRRVLVKDDIHMPIFCFRVESTYVSNEFET